MAKISKESTFRLEDQDLARLRIGNARGEKTFFHPIALDLTETIDTCAHLSVGDLSSLDLLVAGRIDESIFPDRVMMVGGIVLILTDTGEHKTPGQFILGFPDSASEGALDRLFAWLSRRRWGGVRT